MDIPLAQRSQPPSAPSAPPAILDERHTTRNRTRFAAEFSDTPRGAPATDREIRQLYVPSGPPSAWDSVQVPRALPAAEAAATSLHADALLSPRLRLRVADQMHIPYDPRLLVSTQQLSFKPIDRDAATAARYRGVESSYHKTRDELTEYTEAVLRERHIEKLYAKPAVPSTGGNR